MYQAKEEKSINSCKGITLIALIITIIVLLILAGVSISMVVGENGVLNRAQESSIEMEKAKFLEDFGMVYDDIYAGNLEKLDNQPVTIDMIKEKLIKNYGYKEEQILEVETKNINLSGTKLRLRPEKQGEISVTEDNNLVKTYFALIKGKYYKIDFDGSNVNLVEELENLPTEEDLTVEIKSGNDIITANFADGKITVKGKEGQTGKATISVKNGVLEKVIDVKVNELIADIGDVTVNNRVLENDWQYFYDDDTNVYLIYDDYLENSAIPRAEKIIVDGYRIYVNGENGNRYDLIGYLNNNEIWKNFANGVKTAINYKGVSITGSVTATGSPDLELFKNSFEKINETSQFEIKNFESGELNVDYNVEAEGYLYRLKGAEKYTFSIDINNNKKVFFPHQSEWNGTWGYWLSSLSAVGLGEICYIDCTGILTRKPLGAIDVGIRPVVKLPKSNELMELLEISE